jgi:hypothetical protein
MLVKIEGIIDRYGRSLVGHVDHVSFEADGIRGKAGTLRNWTLEARLLGHPERDITPPAEMIDADGPVRSLPGPAGS